ncbi:MAG: cysteine desulfurase family protein [Planctomycetota bacterium]
MKKIYLDYNATTPVAPSVLEVMQPFFMEHFGNPSSSHSFGRAAAEAIEDARGKVAGMINSNPDEIVFTSGGTEANNLALKGALLKTTGGIPGGHLIISSIEHPAITAPARFLERLGIDLTIVPCDSQGIVDPDEIRSAIRPDTVLVSVMHSNNEVGSLQLIEEISQICREHEVLIHTDASQSCGKVPVDVRQLQVDMLTMASHKFYGPKGVGALYLCSGVALEPFMHGAGHEKGLRAGTENTPYIAGMGAAAKLVGQAVGESREKLAEFRDTLLNRLKEEIPGLIVNAERAAKLPNTLSVSFPGVSALEILSRVPELSASTGAACHSNTEDSSTLEAMGVSEEIMRGTIRLSVGWYTNQEELERASNLLIDAWENLHQPA